MDLHRGTTSFNALTMLSTLLPQSHLKRGTVSGKLHNMRDRRALLWASGGVRGWMKSPPVYSGLVLLSIPICTGIPFPIS